MKPQHMIIIYERLEEFIEYPEDITVKELTIDKESPCSLSFLNIVKKFESEQNRKWDVFLNTIIALEFSAQEFQYVENIPMLIGDAILKEYKILNVKYSINLDGKFIGKYQSIEGLMQIDGYSNIEENGLLYMQMLASVYEDICGYNLQNKITRMQTIPIVKSAVAYMKSLKLMKSKLEPLIRKELIHIYAEVDNNASR